MKSGERGSGARSNLDKPLEELTEEDIFQLTREDCRRYLKEKGMRRPSWNKSQAIQQVLSLKGLLESKSVQEEENAGEEAKNSIPLAISIDMAKNKLKQDACGRESSSKQPDVCQDLLRLLPAPDDERSKHGPRMVGERADAAAADPHIPRPFSSLINDSKDTRRVFHHPRSVPFPAISQQHASSNATLPRSVGVLPPADPLTAFYPGTANAYDKIPAEKLAAGAGRGSVNGTGGSNCHPMLTHPPLCNNGFCGLRGAPSSPYQNYNAGFPNCYSLASAPAGGTMLAPISADTEPLCYDVPKTRRASVQRFLKKRKDRGRVKAAACGAPKKQQPSLEMYLSMKAALLRSSSSSDSPARFPGRSDPAQEDHGKFREGNNSGADATNNHTRKTTLLMNSDSDVSSSTRPLPPALHSPSNEIAYSPNSI